MSSSDPAPDDTWAEPDRVARVLKRVLDGSPAPHPVHSAITELAKSLGRDEADVRAGALRLLEDVVKGPKSPKPASKPLPPDPDLIKAATAERAELHALPCHSPDQLRRLAEITEILEDEWAALPLWEAVAETGDEDAADYVKELRKDLELT